MSDTPRTDAECSHTLDGVQIVSADFARELEYELNDKTAMLKRLTAHWDKQECEAVAVFSRETIEKMNLQLEEEKAKLAKENSILKEDYEACRRARVLDWKELLIQRRKALRFGIAIGVIICTIFMKVIGVLP